MEYNIINGAIYGETATVFRLWAPGAYSVRARFFSAGTDEEKALHYGAFPMKPSEDGLWTIELPGDLHGVYYDFLLTDANGHQTVSADPWAKACGANSERSMVVDLKRTNPEGWENDSRIAFSGSPVIWETHVRDFSSDPESGVRPEWRGKYLAFTEKDTTLRSEGALPTCLSYLKQLGVTHVQLQPIADYYTVDELTCRNYNWGYDIENYNVPEGSYSTDPRHGEVRIRECKQMIKAIHEAGLGVILDVVYNHTYRKDSPLSRTAPFAYYRHGWNGEYLNASGCGNETASERAPFRNYMLQSILYWANEYHVDGFRFDLMGVHDTETMDLIRKELDKLPNGSSILTIGEPWSALPTGLSSPYYPANKDNLRIMNSRIAAFADGTRDTLAGHVNSIGEKGFALGYVDGWTDVRLKSAACGWADDRFMKYVNSPSQTVQYCSCHDNYALWDRFSVQTGAATFDGQNPEAEKRTELAAGFYLTSLGLGFLQSGEEFGRSKEGNGNAYNGPEKTNTIRWALTEKHSKMLAWYRGLLGLRKKIMLPLVPESTAGIRFIDSPEGCFAYSRPAPEGTPWSGILFIFASGSKDAELPLPAGKWQLLCTGEDSTLWQTASAPLSGKVTAAAESVTILGSLKETV